MQNFRKTFTKLLSRRQDSNKYDFGHVLVIGGSPGMVGAPLLVGKAALRTGAGLVTIASTPSVIDKLEKRVEEIMTLALPSIVSEALPIIKEFIRERKVSVVVLGPGLEVDSQSISLVRQLLETLELPLIIDGGGLNALQHSPNLLNSSTSKAVILTPHLGEFQRLASKPSTTTPSESISMASQFAQTHGVTLVLKGHPTYVAHKSGPVYENTTGNPGLATAGTGDVLSGVIAGIISQGIDPEKAARAGVYLHGLAGDIAANEKTEPAMIASDVIESIPAAFKRIEESAI